MGSTFSYRFLPELKTYKPLFGLFTLLVAFKILHEVFFSWERERMKGLEEDLSRSHKWDVRTVKLNLLKVEIEFLGRTYSFSTLSPLLAGFLVAVVSSTLGVGGGFLLVPFMASFLRIPMFLVPGTSALSILITMVVSIGNYVKMGAQVDLFLIGLEVLGVVVGSLIGPQVSRHLKERKLRVLLGLILLYIGVGYTVGDYVKNTFGIRII
ncbi:MAG: sulfite exporter TauE/SafE family protein [Aquificota bacterium]|nr:sulfite exporter TauE/SafE family protein [Aquificota bacterium]